MSWNSIHMELQGGFNCFGLYPANSLQEAVHNHVDALAEMAGVSAADHVLDVGAAGGKSSERLRNTIGCTTRSIDIEPLSDGVLFGDMEDIPFPHDTFDVYWSVCTLDIAGDVQKALREARRALKPNGRLVISDWCQYEPDFTGWEEFAREDWTDSVIETYRHMRRHEMSREDYALLRWAFDDARRGVRKHYAGVWLP